MKEINIGILGLGTVGIGIVQLLKKRQAKIKNIYGVHFNLKTIAVRDVNKKRNVELPANTKLCDDDSKVIDDPDIQIVIEVTGNVDGAYHAIQRAMQSGKSVITANKEMLASHINDLNTIAKNNQVNFFYEASVAGGIPILRVLSESILTDSFEQVNGIINGTSNYILSEMLTNQADYHQVLEAAQQLGYAEANPRNDVKGYDAAYKLSILSYLIFGQFLPVSKIRLQGIDQISIEDLKAAQNDGYKIKLIANLKRKHKQLTASVVPTAIKKDEQLANVDGVQNAIQVTSDALGRTTYTGAGAGSLPTANSVLSDLIASANTETNGYSMALQNDNNNDYQIIKNGGKSQYLIIIHLRDNQINSVAKLESIQKIKFDNISTMMTNEISYPELQLLLKKIKNHVHPGTIVHAFPIFKS
ncbi:hypothetical protein WR164_13320 [Philodulcilactobacillus myokoensis]|uniref:Homoserine dehydrogenase n=1 Tax=Philodulcilactobacillus myokoensis TaxID=2929573 RepID=A0A9W6B330_9LACO|nr:homoserine dehydrogenase [Philodulcilactobacillus myokoensis]GLB47353.1 hypothetical protein WR164_13320 [Philodulcilactobacillus myokoensis]